MALEGPLPVVESCRPDALDGPHLSRNPVVGLVYRTICTHSKHILKDQ